MKRPSSWRVHASRIVAVLGLSLAHQPLALAQSTPLTDPALLPSRVANFAWDEALLRASFSFSDILRDHPWIGQKLESGPASTIAMRAILLRQGESTPVTVAVQQCVVSYNLWDNVFKIKLDTASGSTTQNVVNRSGVERICFNAHDLPITSRNYLKPGVPYFLAVVVDVNPVSEAQRAQMRQWMQRPVTAEVGPGDALFSAFAQLLFRNVGGSDFTLEFRTSTVVP